jgi:phospholipase/carboxylesterase
MRSTIFTAMALACAFATTATAEPQWNSATTTLSVLPIAAAPTPPAEDIVREARFVHKLYPSPSGARQTIVLMHGSGGDETTLVALARQIDPEANLLGIRGRIVQNGVKRWYKRVTATEFDQQDVRDEAQAFVSFLAEASVQYDIELARVTFLGYSNGANLIAALSLLHPQLVRKAVLLRPMPVLKQAPQPDLTATRVLAIVGRRDSTYAPFAPELESQLKTRGAQVEAHTIDSGHLIGDEDARIARDWLARLD